MDLSRDELRRQLRQIDADNRTIQPAWREALKRIFGGDTKLTTDEKAAILGVPAPGRRQFFKVGSATFVGAAVLAACGGDDEPTGAADTGDEDPGPSEDTEGEDEGDSSMDLPLAATAASLEVLAVETYATAGDSGLVTTAAIGAAAALFAEHHQLHADALNGVLEQNGAAPVMEANQAVFSTMIEPAISAAMTEADVVQIALELENAAAQTYVFTAGALSTPTLRQTIMTIGGIEARHAAILVMAAQQMPGSAVFPDERAFFPEDNPLPDEALVTP